jgi:hypothetical protein
MTKLRFKAPRKVIGLCEGCGYPEGVSYRDILPSSAYGP